MSFPDSPTRNVFCIYLHFLRLNNNLVLLFNDNLHFAEIALVKNLYQNCKTSIVNLFCYCFKWKLMRFVIKKCTTFNFYVRKITKFKQNIFNRWQNKFEYFRLFFTDNITLNTRVYVYKISRSKRTYILTDIWKQRQVKFPSLNHNIALQIFLQKEFSECNFIRRNGVIPTFTYLS